MIEPTSLHASWTMGSRSRGKLRIPLDPVLGLIPFAGDGITFLVSASLLTRGVQAKAPKPIIVKMMANAVVDLLIGSIPLVGDVFDFFFKANRMNQRLLEEYLQERALEAQDGQKVARSE